MQVNIKPEPGNTADAGEAERILRSCVHCGFCNAACPTYRLLGDELDGPRGRIYLIKSMFEGNGIGPKTMQHLDRCLTCRACETVCPSSVDYGKLLDAGRNYIAQKVSRSPLDKLLRVLILTLFPYRKRFASLLTTGRLFRGIVPGGLKQLIPAKPTVATFSLNRQHVRTVILFSGCVQPALAPNINQAAIKLLDRLGVKCESIEHEQCCGALSQHLGNRRQAKTFMKKNIDLFWPYLERGAESIITTASGCGVQLKDYAYYLRDEDDYRTKAGIVSGKTVDIAEYIAGFDVQERVQAGSKRVAFQNPCTLQHGQKLNDITEKLLSGLGFDLATVSDGHLCCGSAGVYSILQNKIARDLRNDKISKLMAGRPEAILTANIGCYQHLQQVSPVPVRHWVEAVAELIE